MSHTLEWYKQYADEHGYELGKNAEKIIIQETLAHNNGNKTKTAQMLGIGRKTLFRKLNEDEVEE